MAVESLPYGLTKADTPVEVEQERAIANKENPLSANIKNDRVERVTYGPREIEIPAIDHRAAGRPVDKQFERNKASVLHRLRAIGVSKAIVINFLPIMLRTDSLLGPSRKAKIPPPKDIEDFSVWVFDEPYIEPGRRGADSPLLATEWHPIQMAEEFVALNPLGVCAFKGIPADVTNKQWLAMECTEDRYRGRTNGQVIEETRAGSISWMQRELQHGNEMDRQKRNPTLPQKAAARRLKHLGYIKEMPMWVEAQRDVDVKIPMCPKCQKPCEPGAAQCTNGSCGFIIDPKKAYEINAIDESDSALERLTREQVKEMGISKYVAETIDEKPQRIKMGTPKPLSEAAQALKDSEDEYASDRRKQDLQDAAKMLKQAGGGKTQKDAGNGE